MQQHNGKNNRIIQYVFIKFQTFAGPTVSFKCIDTKDTN